MTQRGYERAASLPLCPIAAHSSIIISTAILSETSPHFNWTLYLSDCFRRTSLQRNTLRIWHQLASFFKTPLRLCEPATEPALPWAERFPHLWHYISLSMKRKS